MSLEHTYVIGIAIAALGGAAVGLEREWSGHAGGAEPHFAGIRTFTLLGGMAGVAGWLWTVGFQTLAIVLLAGATALVVAAYVAASHRGVDGTTEVAALVVLSAGILAGTGHLVLASAIVAITTLLLVEKPRRQADRPPRRRGFASWCPIRGDGGCHPSYSRMAHTVLLVGSGLGNSGSLYCYFPG